MRYVTASKHHEAVVAALLIVFAAGMPVSACLWYYGTNVEGGAVSLSAFPPESYVAYLTDHSAEYKGHWRLERSEVENDGNINTNLSNDYKQRSDQAVNLVHKGQVKKAIEIFEEIEKSHPGEYIIAANLGTAYELNGENEKAMKWIREGIQRNPQSHYGTEWLHVRILEAKLALAGDPEWLKSHSVLDLDFGSGAMPVMPRAWPEGQDAQSTLRALEYQLHERLAFVSPPDPIVGELVADLGNLVALTKSLEHGIAVYDLALTFSPIHADLILQRRDAMRPIVSRKHFYDELQRYALIGAVGIGLGYLVVRTKRWMSA